MNATPRQWVNTDADEGALCALLARTALLIPPESIDTLWIFPTRRAGAAESTVLIAATFDDDAERRRVSTVHFTVTRDRKGRATVHHRLDEHATAPHDALTRVVDGVLRRLADDSARAPRVEAIEGDPDRWDSLVVELGGQPRTEPTADTTEPAPDEAVSVPDAAAT
jgi:hypothetical protein